MTIADRPVARVLTSELNFDKDNPRLFVKSDVSQSEIIDILWRDFAVDEVAMSIANNGYFVHEPLFVTAEDNGRTVLEGNRRLAAVRLLTDRQLRQRVKASELPEISADRKDELQTLPVIECTREEVWEYLGFKHVNGPQPWQSYAKAQYVAWLHNDLSISLDRIADSIGDRHWTVRRLYRGLMVLRQGETFTSFDLNDRYKNHFSFSHIYTGLDYKAFRDFLGIDNQKSYKLNPVPVDRLDHLREFLFWLYGRKSTGTRPVVQSQNPDLRNLGTVLEHENSVAALRQGLSLEVALDISKGDERLFLGHLLEAQHRLELAVSKQLTGDTGQPNILQIALKVSDLADHLVTGMMESRKEKRTANRRSHRSFS